jgi:hypothetical protein
VAPETQSIAPHTFTLPVLVASPVDLGRLIRELEMIDNSLLQLGLRSGGEPVEMPGTSHLMEQTIQLNRLNLLHAADRATLQQCLTMVREKAPVIHVSFSADPNTAFIEQLMVWLRREIHPLLLLTVGLQPNIGAGCIVRTTNQHFDFSLRQNFAKKRDLLLSQLAAATSEGAAK